MAAQRGSGRKAVHIDPAQLFKLAVLNCTVADIAGWFGVSKKVIDTRMKNKAIHSFSLRDANDRNIDPAGLSVRIGTYAEILEQGRSCGKTSLRRQLTDMAATKPAAAIFLAKNLLGYKDVIEHGGVTTEKGDPAGVPIQLVITSDESKI